MTPNDKVLAPFGSDPRLPQSSGCHRPGLAGPPVVLTPNAKVLAPLGSDPTAGPGSAPFGNTATSVTVPDDGTSGVMRMQAGLCKPSFVELFCGSAGLSAEMRQLGFQVLGVDNKPTAKQARAPVINLDLRDPEGYRVYSIRFDKNCIRFVFLVIMILFSLRAPLFAEQLLTSHNFRDCGMPKPACCSSSELLLF